jgi:hypothetical protein
MTEDEFDRRFATGHAYHVAPLVQPRSVLDYIEDRWRGGKERRVDKNHRSSETRGPVAVVGRVLENFL